MVTNRRGFLKQGAAVAAAGVVGAKQAVAHAGPRVSPETLDAALASPILRLEALGEPVIIESIELLRAKTGYGDYAFVRVRSKDGAEGYGPTNGREDVLRDILARSVAPFFIGKDARELEALFEGVYRHNSNYKLQGLALWCPVAWVEFAILDMLGQIAGKSIGELFGGVLHRAIPMYVASGSRETTPEQEAERLVRYVQETGCKAVKFKVGGRMSNDADSMPGRTEKLIPLARKALGPDIVIQADANGSYNPPKAIEVGRMLEEIDAYFFEEPCPFDYLEETKTVADALAIPVAGGEQESSEWRFRWMIANNAVQIVQPDLHYYGGFIRSTRVARMAQAAGIPITLHLSGGLGYAQMVHFASCTPNLGRFQEYKGEVQQTGAWFDPPITFRDGALTVPTAPGFGMVAAKELLERAERIG
jgi:L-alanine-DL-glutamate epimerase-like enolase superfamily enzyme